jgi:hypothetical protein
MLKTHGVIFKTHGIIITYHMQQAAALAHRRRSRLVVPAQALLPAPRASVDGAARRDSYQGAPARTPE